jgi:hypothetical protein
LRHRSDRGIEHRLLFDDQGRGAGYLIQRSGLWAGYSCFGSTATTCFAEPHARLLSFDLDRQPADFRENSQSARFMNWKSGQQADFRLACSADRGQLTRMAG